MHSRLCFFVTMIRHPLPSTLFPYTTLFRSGFYGFVQPSEFGLLTDNTDGQQDFNGANLALAVGLAQGTAQYSDTAWMKFSRNGEIVFVPVKPIRQDRKRVV